MPLDENSRIMGLLTVTNDLERMAETLMANAEDESSLEVYGMFRNSAYKLRDAALNLWKTWLDENGQSVNDSVKP